MDVVGYGHPPDKRFYDTWRKIQKASPELKLKLYRKLDLFVSRLRQPNRKIAAVLLYMADKTTLADLLVLRPVLEDLAVLILLNDQEPEILRFSHTLRPRVIIYPCWRVEDICSVLERCISRYYNRQKNQIAAAGSSESAQDYGESRQERQIVIFNKEER
ncbi:MAG: hypothetical protein ACYDH8_07600 [Syntrophales bacterium]